MGESQEVSDLSRIVIRALEDPEFFDYLKSEPLVAARTICPDISEEDVAKLNHEGLTVELNGPVMEALEALHGWRGGSNLVWRSDDWLKWC